MKKNTVIALLGLGFSALSVTSCVPKKKLTAAQFSLDSLHNQYKQLDNRFNTLNANYDDVRSRLKMMENANESASQDLETTTQKLSLRERQLQLQADTLARLQQAMAEQNARIEEVRRKMSEALGNFKSDELTVTTQNGKVFVSMQEKLLFPSGSAVVNTDGRQALKQLADALNNNPDINIEVSGNTDTVPIRIKFEDNWALSVARATAITRILINDYQVAPERITASGRSEYDPVADNTTPEGRAKNRRTDIILAPKLDEIAALLQSGK